MANAKTGRDGVWIYRPWITRNGKRIYASSYGLKAWRIWVPDPPP